MLAVGGIGLPLWPYDPADPDRPHFLQRLSSLSEAAGAIPFQAAPQRVTGVLPADHPAALTRYGSTFTGWLMTEGVSAPLKVSGLPRGRYRVRMWDPGQDKVLEERLAWSEGSGFDLALPQGVQAVFLRAVPVSSVASPSTRRYQSRRSASRPKRTASRSTSASAKAKAAAAKKAKALAAAKKKKSKQAGKSKTSSRKSKRATKPKKPAVKKKSAKKTKSKAKLKKAAKKPAPKKRTRRR